MIHTIYKDRHASDLLRGPLYYIVFMNFVKFTINTCMLGTSSGAQHVVFFDDRAKDHRKKHVCWEAPQGHDTLYFSMRLLKSAIKTLKLGTSSREQYNIIVLDLL